MFWWDWTDWSLSIRQRGTTNFYIQLFALKCGECGHWSFGCRDHWFCGSCQECADYLDGCSCSNTHECEAHRA